MTEKVDILEEGSNYSLPLNQSLVCENKGNLKSSKQCFELVLLTGLNLEDKTLTFEILVKRTLSFVSDYLGQQIESLLSVFSLFKRCWEGEIEIEKIRVFNSIEDNHLI
jgi:hypothetical protein